MVVLTGHGGIFAALMTQHPLVIVDSGVAHRFSNCEIRPMLVSFGAAGEDGRPTINLNPAPPEASNVDTA